MSKRNQEGYISIDHRMSPGITEADLLTIPEYRRKEFQATRGLFESPTIRCCHCGTIVVLNPGRTRARSYCQKCDHYVCDQYFCTTNCTPFEKIIDNTLEQAAKSLNKKEI